MGGRYAIERAARDPSSSPFWDCSRSAAPHAASAQSYPTRPITIIVPYPAGGPSDMLTRILAERMKAALGQTVIIENVTGAGGSIGVGRVARSAPDGYTLAIGHNQTHVINAASMNLPYDVVKDFEPVSLIADTPHWLISRKTLPANNVKELIAWLKANKATAGLGRRRRPDRSRRRCRSRSRPARQFQFVPYRGGAPLLQDLLAGQIDITFGQAANYLGPCPQRPAQGLRGAVPSSAGGRRRTCRPWTRPACQGIYASFWHGLWAPKGTPKEIIAKLDAAVIETLADPAVQQRFKDIGQETWPRDKQTPEALAEQQKTEIDGMVAGHQGQQHQGRMSIEGDVR